MARKPVFTDDEKALIAHQFLRNSKRRRQGDMTQDDLAQYWGVSRRTIQRVLIEKGIIAPYKTRGPRSKPTFALPRLNVPLTCHTPAGMQGFPISTQVSQALAPAMKDALTHGLGVVQQMTLGLKPIKVIRWVNVYEDGPAPVMHLSQAHARANASTRKKLNKTVPVEIPL